MPPLPHPITHAGYRNVIGLPGGIRSPFMEVLRQENVNGMTLKEGRGNSYRDSGPSEGDAFNTVWIVDSTALPFYQAEVYHQFHNGIGALPQRVGGRGGGQGRCWR